MNFSEVWCATRKGRKKMSVKWLKRLETASAQGHPELLDLVLKALALNRRDEFQMFDGLDPKYNISDVTMCVLKSLLADPNNTLI